MVKPKVDQPQHIDHTHPGQFSMEAPGHFSVAINRRKCPDSKFLDLG